MHPHRRLRRASRRNTCNNSGYNENLDKNFSITPRNAAHPLSRYEFVSKLRSILEARNSSMFLSLDFTRYPFTRVLRACNRKNMFSFDILAFFIQDCS